MIPKSHLLIVILDTYYGFEHSANSMSVPNCHDSCTCELFWMSANYIVKKLKALVPFPSLISWIFWDWAASPLCNWYDDVHLLIFKVPPSPTQIAFRVWYCNACIDSVSLGKNCIQELNLGSLMMMKCTYLLCYSSALLHVGAWKLVHICTELFTS